MRSGFLSIENARAIIGVDTDEMRALLTSGLLGYWENDTIPVEAVEHYIAYGTQWRHELGNRSLDIFVNVLEHEKAIDHPLSTQITMAISPSPNVAKDILYKRWIAHFYVRCNEFYYPDFNAFSRVGPVVLTLPKKAEVSGEKFRTVLYPDPQGRFAMLAIYGSRPMSDSASEALAIAYDEAVPILDRLSSKYSCALPIVQMLLVGIPSGTIYVPTSKQTRVEEIIVDDMLNRNLKLANARALYREAVSSNSPFYQFLTLWRSYENLCRIRADWRMQIRGCSRSDGRYDVSLRREVFPDVFAFAPYGGKSFGEVKELLRASHRNASSHGEDPKTPVKFADFSQMATGVPLVRYMAEITMVNVEACLSIGGAGSDNTDRSR